MNLRILHCADFHGNLDWYYWLRQSAPEFDLVCISGDLLDLHQSPPMRPQIDEVITLLGDFPVPLAICSGNHDMVHDDGPAGHPLWMHRLRRTGLWLDGDHFRLQGQKFRCLGWNSPVPASGEGEIWITHAPADQCAVGVTRQGVDYGDHDLGELFRSGRGPRLALCGHVHEPRAWHAEVGGTMILNPSHSMAAPFPNHVILDFGQRSAELKRFLGAPDTISLWSVRPEEVLAGLTKSRLEELLAATIANQRIEGHEPTPTEIAQIRQNLEARMRAAQRKEDV